MVMTDDDFKVFGIREPISSFDECGSGRGLTEGLCTQLIVHFMLLIYKIIVTNILEIIVHDRGASQIIKVTPSPIIMVLL